jgi:ketosteroid isomerase-like protein
MTASARAFLDDVLPLMQAADLDLHNGHPAARAAMWSRNDPVTLFGAAYTVGGWDDVSSVFEKLAAQFSDCRSFEIEVVAAEAGADFGYVVAIERTTASIGGRPPAAYALRVTTIFRRENEHWRIVHRHGDPHDDSASALASQLRDDS